MAAADSAPSGMGGGGLQQHCAAAGGQGLLSTHRRTVRVAQGWQEACGTVTGSLLALPAMPDALG